MNLSFPSNAEKDNVFNAVEDNLASQHFIIIAQDRQRPWGGFFVIDEQQAEKFTSIYFPHINKNELLTGNKLSPKILIVAPKKRLSWQYHHRRAEIWKLVAGNVAVIKSDTDIETEPINLTPGDILQLKQGERHRLTGLDEWGIIAEIWRHTDIHHPSDENDIVRVQDDFGR